MPIYTRARIRPSSTCAPDQPKDFRLIPRILKRVVSTLQPRLKTRGDAAGPSLVPCASRRAHVKRFDVQRREAERVLAEIPMEVVIDERPVERGVEAD